MSDQFMREMQTAPATAPAEAISDDHAQMTALAVVFGGGAVPDVAETDAAKAAADHDASASEQAYDAPAHEASTAATDHPQNVAHHEAHAVTSHFHYTGEPLPALKEILQGKHGKPARSLADFLSMYRQATVRRGTGGARTFISPADGMAAIITGVVLSIVEKYREHGTPAQQKTLDKILADHLRLLSLPMTADGRGGGHRVSGVKHEGRGLVGPALSHGASVRVETVNQTAVVLLGLERLVENPDFAAQHPRIQHLLDVLTPELKASVLHCYKGGDEHRWHYGLSGRLEDASHLKTTWDMLTKLGRSKSKDAEWFAAQAHRIARAWPRVTGSWDGLHDTPGVFPTH